MLHPRLRLLALAACAGAAFTAPAAAQSLVGKLTCTADVTRGEARSAERDWKMTCAFEQASGQVQH